MFESSLSGGKFDLREEIRERGVKSIKGALRASRGDRTEGARGPKRPSVQPRIEHGDLGADRCDAIPVGARDPFEETVEAEPAEIVRHRAGRIRVGISTLQLGDVIAQLPMANAGGRQRKETERVHERVDARVAEAKAGGALIVDEDGRGDGVELVFADQAVVAQGFDV